MTARLMAEASRGAEGVPGAVVATQAAGAMPDGMLAVEMAAHEDAQAGTGAAARLLGDLERHAGGGDDIVPPDHAFFLDAEDLVEIGAAEGHEGRAAARSRGGLAGCDWRARCAGAPVANSPGCARCQGGRGRGRPEWDADDRPRRPRSV